MAFVSLSGYDLPSELLDESIDISHSLNEPSSQPHPHQAPLKPAQPSPPHQSNSTFQFSLPLKLLNDKSSQQEILNKENKDFLDMEYLNDDDLALNSLSLDLKTSPINNGLDEKLQTNKQSHSKDDRQDWQQSNDLSEQSQLLEQNHQNQKSDDTKNENQRNSISSSSWSRHSLQEGAPEIILDHFTTTTTSSKQDFNKYIIICALLMFSWFFFAIWLSLFNKTLLSNKLYHFEYPILTIALQMLIHFWLSSLFMFIIWPKNQHVTSKSWPSASVWIKTLAPTAAASACDIVLSNMSLRSISLTFYTMCKSSSPLFVLIFAFILKLETPSWTLSAIMTLICSGVLLMVMHETDFVIIGFIQVMGASMASGLRWALTQTILDKNRLGMISPYATIFFLSPLMFIFSMIASVIFEGFSYFQPNQGFSNAEESMHTFGIISVIGSKIFFSNS